MKYGSLSSRIWHFFGVDRLNKEFKTFLGVFISFSVFISISAIFINTFFYRLTGNPNIVMQYNIIAYVTVAVVKAIATCVVRKTSPLMVCRIGLTFYALFYITFFFSMSNLGVMMPILAIFSGSGSAFFYLSYFANISAYSTDETRDTAFSVLAVVSCTVNILMPTISGSIIGLFATSSTASGDINYTGYYAMFALSLIIVIIGILISLKLPSLKTTNRKIRLWDTMKMVVQRSELRALMLGELFKGLRDGPFSFFLSLVLFQIVTNESITGLNSLLCGIASLLSSWIYGKIARVNNRIKFIFIAVTALLLASCMLLFNMSVIFVIIFSVINSTLGIFISNPSLSIFVHITEVVGDEYYYEMYTMREFCLQFGSIIGVVFITILSNIEFSSNLGIVIPLIVLVAVQYLTCLVSKIASDKVNKLSESGVNE